MLKVDIVSMSLGVKLVKVHEFGNGFVPILFSSIEAMGELDEKGYRIGDWIVFDTQGKPSRYVKYIQPFREEEPLTGKL